MEISVSLELNRPVKAIGGTAALYDRRVGYNFGFTIWPRSHWDLLAVRHTVG